MQLDHFLARLEGVTGTAPQFSARCPSHSDTSASLSVSQAEDGTILAQCHAGCSFTDIVEAVGLRPRHLFPGNEAPITLLELAEAKRLPVEFLAAHGLHDLDGEGVGITYRGLDGRVVVKIRSALVAKAGSRWRKGDAALAYGLWRLPEFVQHRWLVLVEGETDTLTGWLHGLPIIGVPGAKLVKRTIDASVLAGIETVFAVQEPDDGGAEFIRGIASRLGELGWQGQAHVIRLAGGVKDLSELHLRAPTEFIDRFNAAAQQARPLGEVASELREEGTPIDGDPWPEPAVLTASGACLPHLEADALPGSLAPWINDAAYRMACPPEFVAVPALIALGAVVGRKVCIRPKAADSWTIASNKWGAVVSPPGTLKSPAAEAGLAPLKSLEAHYRAQHASQAAQNEIRRIEAKVRRAALETAVKQAIDSGQDPSTLHAQAAAALATVAGPKRFVTSDATIEKLAEVLTTNSNGILYERDELTGWLRQLDKDGHEGDRAFFLEGWDGKGEFIVDRIGRGTIHVPANCISLFGTIQPGVFKDYLRGAVRGGKQDDGLIQRLQLLVVGEDGDDWQYIDAAPDAQAIRMANTVYTNLEQMTPGHFGAVQGDGLPYLRFTPSGQQLFNAWIVELETKLRRPGLHPAVRAHLAKYRSLVPSLALLFHLADVAGGMIVPGPVSEAAMDLAIEWSRVLEAHAQRLYSWVLDSHDSAALLGRRIRSRELTDGFTARDIERKNWSGLDRDSVEEGLSVLEAAHWVRRAVKKTGGRDRVEYLVNPKVLGETFVTSVTPASQASSL